MDNDTLFCILEFLQLFDILNWTLACKQFNFVTNNELKWKTLFINTYKNNTIANNYQLQYKKHHRLNIFLMKTIGNTINNCLHLTAIRFTTCGIYNIPSEITLLHNLETLYLDGNKLQCIPAEINQLHNLRKLHLNDNYIQFIPREMYQLNNLQELHLQCNQLQSISRKISQLHNLHTLNLSTNCLRSVPSEIGSLYNLYFLSLSKNPLQSIPREIGSLHQLNEFYLYDTQIKFIPSQIEQLNTSIYLCKSQFNLISDHNENKSCNYKLFPLLAKYKPF